MNDRHRAGKVGAVAELLSVSLRSVDARLPEPEPSDDPFQLDVSWETTFEKSTATCVCYSYRMAVDASSAHEFHLACEFELEYRLPDENDIEDDDLTAFGDISVTFSAFPYARELVQSLTTRASLPPLVLGTLRAPIDPPEIDQSTEVAAVDPE